MQKNTTAELRVPGVRWNATTNSPTQLGEQGNQIGKLNSRAIVNVPNVTTGNDPPNTKEPHHTTNQQNNNTILSHHVNTAAIQQQLNATQAQPNLTSQELPRNLPNTNRNTLPKVSSNFINMNNLKLPSNTIYWNKHLPSLIPALRHQKPIPNPNNQLLILLHQHPQSNILTLPNWEQDIRKR